MTLVHKTCRSGKRCLTCMGESPSVLGPEFPFPFSKGGLCPNCYRDRYGSYPWPNDPRDAGPEGDARRRQAQARR